MIISGVAFALPMIDVFTETGQSQDPLLVFGQWLGWTERPWLTQENGDDQDGGQDGLNGVSGGLLGRAIVQTQDRLFFQGLEALADLALQQGVHHGGHQQDVSQGDYPLWLFETERPHPGGILDEAEGALDGLITNDQFCL